MDIELFAQQAVDRLFSSYSAGERGKRHSCGLWSRFGEPSLQQPDRWLTRRSFLGKLGLTGAAATLWILISSDARIRLRSVVLRWADQTGVMDWFLNSSYRRERLVIFGFHGVARQDENLWNPAMFMDRKTLEARFQYLQKKNYNVLSLGDALERLRQNSLPPRTHKQDIQQLNHPAAPSPVTDGERVYVFFKDFGLLAYDSSGKELWRAALGPFTNTQGLGASPILRETTSSSRSINSGTPTSRLIPRETASCAGRVRAQKRELGHPIPLSTERRSAADQGSRELHEARAAAGFNGNPSVTPDGRLAVFQSSRTGNTELWLKNLRTGKEVQLTNTPRATRADPPFSPDGTSQCVYPVVEGKVSRDWLLLIEGGFRNCSARAVATPASWFPDNRHVLFNIAPRSAGTSLAR